MLTWFAILAGLVACFVVLSIRKGPHAALGLVVVASWLFPSWLIFPITAGPSGSIVGSGPDLKMATSAACLILYCFLPGRTFPVRPIPSDFALLGLILTHLASDLFNDGFSWKLIGSLYAEWYLPYVCGRIALHGRNEIDVLWKAVASAAIFLASCSIIESLIDWHLLEQIFGPRPVEGSNRDGSRWGIQRAYGPTLHPIYFGVLQLLMLGCVAFAALRALKRRAHALWVFAPIIPIAGIVCTASRGPILGIPIAATAALFFFVGKLRWPIGILFVICAAVGVTFQEPIIVQLEKWSGESRREIEIQGEERIQSSVRSRINLIEVNKIALKRSGLLGFGSEAVAGFPINVPVGEMEAKTLKAVKYIDNTYILLTLRFGYLGVGFFVLAIVLSLWQFFTIANRYRGRSAGTLAGCLGATLFAAAVVQATVWMPPDIGFPFVWTMGASSGLVGSHLKGRLNPKREPPRREGPTSARKSSSSSVEIRRAPK